MRLGTDLTPQAAQGTGTFELIFGSGSVPKAVSVPKHHVKLEYTRRFFQLTRTLPMQHRIAKLCLMQHQLSVSSLSMRCKPRLTARAEDRIERHLARQRGAGYVDDDTALCRCMS